MNRVVAALTLALLPWFASADTSPTLLPARVDQAIHARMEAGEYPALVIAVVDGKQSRLYAYGKLANGNAPDADTVFEIGSVTKTFTATLLAQAVNDGKLKLDTPVAELLPGFTIPSRDGKFITLENLATQHSGLPRMPGNFMPADPSNPFADYDATRLKAFLAGYTLTRDPGSHYEYSNLGVGMLGYALAQHAGSTYDVLVQQQIFTPLDMRSSATTLSPSMRAHLAQGHDKTGKIVGNWAFDTLAGAGAIKSTGADMLRYLKANMGLLKTSLYPAMQLAQKPRADVPSGRIGLVWMTRHDAGGDVIWHNGMTGGYASFMGFTADRQHGVVVLTNVSLLVEDLGFATLLRDATLAPSHKAAPMAPTVLDEYIGSYQLAPKFILKVFRANDQLYAQASGQGAIPIFPSAANEFFAKVGDISISFRRDKTDKVDALVLHQHGERLAPRISDAEADAAVGEHAVTLAPATLANYVGRYRLGPNVMFDVTLKDGQLMVQLTGQSAFPVFASAHDKFFYRVVDAQIDFQRNASGKVDALILHQNGIDQRAPRVETDPLDQKH